MLFKLIGLLISLATLALIFLLSGSPLMFIDIPSIVIMTGIILGGAIFGYGNHIFSYVRNSRKKTISSSELFATLDFYNYLTRLTLYAGVLSFVIATVLTLAQSKDTSAIGPSIALSLITCLCGMLISYLLIQPLKHGVLYQNMNSSKKAATPQTPIQE